MNLTEPPPPFHTFNSTPALPMGMPMAKGQGY